MRIVLHSGTDITLTGFDEPGFEVESESPDAHFSALPMFAASLGLCTYSVIAEYARRFDAPTDEIDIDVTWNYVEDPYRIGEIDMEIRWPSLPESRQQAVERAAAQCTIHNTLVHPPSVETTVRIPAEKPD